MTTLHPQLTLAEIVTIEPSLARHLEANGLDYCCGGAATLAQACADSDLDPVAVLHELTDAATDAATGAAPDDWSSMGVAELVDHIEAIHHQYLWSELPRLAALLDKVRSVHATRHPELIDIQACFTAIRADLEPHLVKEERVLFPMVRQLAAATGAAADAAPAFGCGSITNPISVMLGEHDAVGALLRRLRDLTGGYATPADGCASYTALFDGLGGLEADTHLHIHKENNLLFPAVVELEQQPAS